MPTNPFQDFIDGFTGSPGSNLAEHIAPRWTFNDVVLPDETRRALDHALAQIEHHDLLYRRWGLAERHRAGLGLAFNFAGPPGTGKTICAEAVAHELDRPLLQVQYAEMQSMWVGNTGKNVESVFQQADKHEAVLFFDEADALAGRRFSGADHGYQREANAVVNVLLRELEHHSGVVIFATNLAANLDPAFERRIRTHVRFRQPGPEERRRIWEKQIHPRKTPLAGDVDFQTLAQNYEASGGDIKNAVLKAAQQAAASDEPDSAKRIRQEHLREGIEDVLAGKDVMKQSLFEEENGRADPFQQFSEQLTQHKASLDDDLGDMERRLSEQQETQADLAKQLHAIQEEREAEREELSSRLQHATRLGLTALVVALLALAAVVVLLAV
jgi:SpoVK/Ycf46/Vps4 family AAA+-type ATPase